MEIPHVLVMIAAIFAIAAFFLSQKSEPEISDVQRTLSYYKAAVIRIEGLEKKNTELLESNTSRVNELQMSMVAFKEEIQKGLNSMANYSQGVNHKIELIDKSQNIIEARQHSLEKKIIGQAKTVNLKFESPMPVSLEYTQKPKEKPPVGKGQETLLKKAGVR